MGICSIPDCGITSRVRGWCDKHYARWKRTGNPLCPRRVGGWAGCEKKSTLRASTRPSMRDLAWAAGFLEGEGCFSSIRGSARILAVQVNREPIDRLLSVFGGATRLYTRTRTPQWRPVWNWYVSGSRARGVMFTLYPMMTTKRKGQIRHAITRPNRRDVETIVPAANTQGPGAPAGLVPGPAGIPAQSPGASGVAALPPGLGGASGNAGAPVVGGTLGA